ncbi:MAG: hypothetical protein LBD60_01680 [Puniceicoccales bacterium]|jgi:hypothetical protein|nr:hypothetical protein [Puniceicoccales bacterium]
MAQLRGKIKGKNSERKEAKAGILERNLESVKPKRDLDEFATAPSEEKKRYLESIAYTVDSRVQSLILWRLEQIEKGQGGE